MKNTAGRIWGGAKVRKLAPFLALGLGFFVSVLFFLYLQSLGQDEEFRILGKSLYWIPALLVLANALSFYWLSRRPVGAATSKKAYLAGLLVSLLLAFQAGLAFEPKQRVQWDESELYNTSMAMYFTHSALAPSMALPGAGTGELNSIFFSLRETTAAFPFFREHRKRI